MSEQDLMFAPAWQLRDLVAARQLSPVEVTELFLRRVEALNPRLNAYLTVAADQAIRAARQAEAAVSAGKRLGPLHGIPISIKDLTFTKGIRTTRGSLLFQDDVPLQDDVAVLRIRRAGAIILGKTNTPEFGYSGTTENLLGDDCRNPWDPACTAGGSSGGAGAALAAGLCPLAQGSDGGGSIRIPSAMCGVYGLKPSQGRVPRPYQPPGGWGPFSQNGPMARTVADAALLLQVMAGPHPSDPTSMAQRPPNFVASLKAVVRGLRFGWSPDLGSAPVDPEVRQRAEQAALVFAELGASVEEAPLALDTERVREVFETVWLSDYAANYGELATTRGDEMTPALRESILRARGWSAAKLATALRELEWHRARVRAVFQHLDVLLTPTLATTAFPVGRRPRAIGGQPVDPAWGFTPFTYPINMAGNPAASIPCGFSSQGLPIGLHIIGRRGDETTVLRASAAFEQARPWAHLHPPVS
ncbi:MAG: amidase [Chloroflexi bacterium]|nr:amidase [Chloroflexota bacterium]